MAWLWPTSGIILKPDSRYLLVSTFRGAQAPAPLVDVWIQRLKDQGFVAESLGEGLFGQTYPQPDAVAVMVSPTRDIPIMEASLAVRKAGASLMLFGSDTEALAEFEKVKDQYEAGQDLLDSAGDTLSAAADTAAEVLGATSWLLRWWPLLVIAIVAVIVGVTLWAGSRG